MTLNAKRQGSLQLSPDFAGLLNVMEKFNIITQQLDHSCVIKCFQLYFQQPDQIKLPSINRQHTSPPSASCWKPQNPKTSWRPLQLGFVGVKFKRKTWPTFIRWPEISFWTNAIVPYCLLPMWLPCKIYSIRISHHCVVSKFCWLCLAGKITQCYFIFLYLYISYCSAPAEQLDHGQVNQQPVVNIPCTHHYVC